MSLNQQSPNLESILLCFFSNSNHCRSCPSILVTADQRALLVLSNLKFACSQSTCLRSRWCCRIVDLTSANSKSIKLIHGSFWTVVQAIFDLEANDVRSGPNLGYN